MARQVLTAENVLLPDGWHKSKKITVTDGFISDISDSDSFGKEYDAAYAVPALIDNHIHGGFGFDVTECTAEGLQSFLARLGGIGIGGIQLCPYGTRETVQDSMRVCREIMTKQKEGKVHGARLLGVHPEGPFLSVNRPGAMLPETILKPTPEAFDAFFEPYTDLISEMTLAPEEDIGFATVTALRRRNIHVLAGHTDCDYEAALAAFKAGVGATCHTFNAMRPIKHRDPGLLTAALTTPSVYSEFIGDTVHLHPGTLRLLFACKGADRLMLVSDAVKTTGMPDGVYQLPFETVYVKNGESRLEDGTLDGGGCMISESVSRLAGIGLSPFDVLQSASVTPAAWLGIGNACSLKVGNTARIACFDEHLKYQKNICNRW